MKAPKQMHSRKFTISRDCSHCESETAYTINIESSTHWYSLVAQENKFFAVIVTRSKLIKIQNGSLNPNGKIEKSHDIKLIKFLS
jgi:hypothetical protein